MYGDGDHLTLPSRSTLPLFQLSPGVPPELIIANECLHVEGAPHCQDEPRWFDTSSRAEATRD